MHPGVQAQRFPDKAACVMAGSGEVVSYRELDERSNRLAQLMWDAGLRRGDHVALLLENHPRLFEVYWAAIRSGLYITTVNHHLSPAEAAYIVDDCGAQVLVTSAALSELAGAILPEIANCSVRLMVDGTRDGYRAYETALEGFPAEPLAEQPRGQAMLYSSGTTGRPKGILRPLSGASMDDPNPLPALYARLFSLDSDTVYLSPAPLYHAAPLGLATTMHSLGATVVVLEHFDALEALRAIEAHRITHSQWVPTMFTRMLKLPEADRHRHDLGSHRVAIHGAAPCPPRVKRDMIEWWGPILVENYAATEGNGLTVIDSKQWLEHEGSVGRPVYGEIHVCGEDGVELPAGQDGLIYFEYRKGNFAYHGDEEKTRSARHPDHPGWSTLGDMGHLDEDGFLYLTDRQSFMIISGGVNVYPAESENVLITHPAVLDVAVFGVPNPDFGEEVKAVVQLVEGREGSPELEQELLAFCREHIAHFKCPRSVDFAAELPRLPTGKLYKRVLRDRYWGRRDSKIV